MTSRGRPGFTLLEVLVAAVLLLLLIGLVFSFLIPTMKAAVRGTTRVELQQMAVLAVGKLAADLQNTTAAGLGLYTDGSVPSWPRTTFDVGINPIQDVAADGTQEWFGQIIVYSYRPGAPGDPNGGQLIRKLYPDPIGAPSTLQFIGGAPLRVSGNTLDNIAKGSRTTETVVASNVTKFEVWTTNGSDSVISDPVYIDLQVQRQDSSQQTPQQFEMTRTVSMRQRL